MGKGRHSAVAGLHQEFAECQPQAAGRMSITRVCIIADGVLGAGAAVSTGLGDEEVEAWCSGATAANAASNTRTGWSRSPWQGELARSISLRRSAPCGALRAPGAGDHEPLGWELKWFGQNPFIQERRRPGPCRGF